MQESFIQPDKLSCHFKELNSNLFVPQPDNSFYLPKLNSRFQNQTSYIRHRKIRKILDHKPELSQPDNPHVILRSLIHLQLNKYRRAFAWF